MQYLEMKHVRKLLLIIEEHDLNRELINDPFNIMNFSYKLWEQAPINIYPRYISHILPLKYQTNPLNKMTKETIAYIRPSTPKH